MDRYARQVSFAGIGRQGQLKLNKSRVLIAGLGALGSAAAGYLARAGVGFIRLLDRDYVELGNIQRQQLYTEEDAANEMPKAIAAERAIGRINSDIETQAVICDLDSGNIDEYISDVDLILDASDNVEIRKLMGEACVEKELPWIYGGAIGAYGMTMNFLPGDDKPCFHCLFGDLEPGDETCASVGVLNTATGIVAGLQATEALKILTDSDDVRRELLTLDLWSNEFELTEVPKQKDCPVCVKHQYSYYGKPASFRVTFMCGKPDSAMVTPDKPRRIDFADMAERLNASGKTKYNDFIFDFDDGNVSFKIFKDGRAIIQNVPNEEKARSVYGEYIGM